MFSEIPNLEKYEKASKSNFWYRRIYDSDTFDLVDPPEMAVCKQHYYVQQMNNTVTQKQLFIFDKIVSVFFNYLKIEQT